MPKDVIADYKTPNSQADSAQAQLQREAEASAQVRQRESLLSRGITELAGVRRTGTSLTGLGMNPTTREMLDAVAQNRSDRMWESDVTELGTGLLKTGCLFLKGRAAFVGTALVYALDEIKPGSSAVEMLLDGTLGATKGIATREFLHWGAAQGWSPGKLGIALGGTGRLADSALSRSTYLDKEGKVNFSGGLQNIAKTTLNPISMATDYAVFSFSHAALGKLDGLTGGRIGASPFWRTVATGESLGLSSGLVGESMRQYHEGEFDPMRVLKFGLAKGALDGIAAMPGGFQASRMTALARASERSAQPAKVQEFLPKPSLAETGKTEFDPMQRERVTERLASLKPGQPQGDENFMSWADKNIEQKNVPSVQYKADGVRIVVPENYDTILGQLRQWRLDAQKSGVTEMPKDNPLYEYRNRALPEDVAAAIKGTPRPDFLTKVRMLDSDNPQDAFTRQTEPEHRSAMAASPDRIVDIYKPEQGWLLGKQFQHEWWHVAKWEMPEHSYRFDLASQLERDGFFADQYGRTNADENWATHGSAELSSDNSGRAAVFAHRAPLRTATILTAAREALNGTNPTEWTESQRTLDRNIKTLLPDALDASRAMLRNTLNNSTNTGDVEVATKLLLHFGQPDDFAAITRPIKDLSFRTEPVNADVIRNLTRLPGVENLSFRSTHMEPDAYKELASVRGLRSLTLDGLEIHDYDLRNLGNALGKSPTFQSLRLLNHFGEVSLTTQRVLQYLRASQ